MALVNGIGTKTKVVSDMLKSMDIVKEITDISLSYADEEFDEFVLEIEVNYDEKYISQDCFQLRNNQATEIRIPGKDGHDIMMLSFQLHEAMKEHTGGDLKKYVIRIDETGKAMANFEYHDPQPENTD